MTGYDGHTALDRRILNSMRVDFDPETMRGADFYRFLTSVVIPRPIAWISTVTPDGSTENLAPHSFFSIASQYRPADRAVHLARPQGFPAQCRGHRGVRGQLLLR